MALTPMQQTILAHPAWDRGLVVASDIVSQVPGDGLPKNAKAAQRMLCALNGGVDASGEQHIWWRPSKHQRYAYERAPQVRPAMPLSRRRFSKKLDKQGRAPQSLAQTLGAPRKRAA